jgi:hypothetical protein
MARPTTYKFVHVLLLSCKSFVSFPFQFRVTHGDSFCLPSRSFVVYLNRQELTDFSNNGLATNNLISYFSKGHATHSLVFRNVEMLAWYIMDPKFFTLCQIDKLKSKSLEPGMVWLTGLLACLRSFRYSFTSKLYRLANNPINKRICFEHLWC